MTAQILDALLLNAQRLSIVGVNGSGLFDPFALGMHPFSRITSCWRGYVCGYKVLQDKFFLHRLQINLEEEAPLIHGVKPFAQEHGTFKNVYAELNLPIDFTGGILAASDFIQELYVHMGFHPAWKYRNVFELVIAHGAVLETRNVSGRMDEIRQEMIKSPLQPGVDATKERIEKWVASTFKRDYKT
jgi:hypothetical protein